MILGWFSLAGKDELGNLVKNARHSIILHVFDELWSVVGHLGTVCTETALHHSPEFSQVALEVPHVDPAVDRTYILLILVTLVVKPDCFSKPLGAWLLRPSRANQATHKDQASTRNLRIVHGQRCTVHKWRMLRFYRLHLYGTAPMPKWSKMRFVCIKLQMTTYIFWLI